MSNQPLQKVEEPGRKEDEDSEISREEEDHSDEGGSKMENPLDKYMKIVLEARQKQQTEVSLADSVKLCTFAVYGPFPFPFQSPVIEAHSEPKDKNLSVKEDDRYNLLL